jgi:hypothetical protein
MKHKSANSSRFVQIDVKNFIFARKSIIFGLQRAFTHIARPLNSVEWQVVTTYQPYFRESIWKGLNTASTSSRR